MKLWYMNHACILGIPIHLLTPKTVYAYSSKAQKAKQLKNYSLLWQQIKTIAKALWVPIWSITSYLLVPRQALLPCKASIPESCKEVMHVSMCARNVDLFVQCRRGNSGKTGVRLPNFHGFGLQKNLVHKFIYHYTTAIHVAIINCCGADGNSNVTLTAVAGVLVVALTPNAEVVTLEPRLRFEVVLLRLGFRFSHGQARFGTWSLMRFIVLPISARNQSGRICV